MKNFNEFNQKWILKLEPLGFNELSIKIDRGEFRLIFANMDEDNPATETIQKNWDYFLKSLKNKMYNDFIVNFPGQSLNEMAGENENNDYNLPKHPYTLIGQIFTFQYNFQENENTIEIVSLDPVDISDPETDWMMDYKVTGNSSPETTTIPYRNMLLWLTNGWFADEEMSIGNEYDKNEIQVQEDSIKFAGLIGRSFMMKQMDFGQIQKITIEKIFFANDINSEDEPYCEYRVDYSLEGKTGMESWIDLDNTELTLLLNDGFIENAEFALNVIDKLIGKKFNLELKVDGETSDYLIKIVSIYPMDDETQTDWRIDFRNETTGRDRYETLSITEDEIDSLLHGNSIENEVYNLTEVDENVATGEFTTALSNLSMNPETLIGKRFLMIYGGDDDFLHIDRVYPADENDINSDWAIDFTFEGNMTIIHEEVIILSHDEMEFLLTDGTCDTGKEELRSADSVGAMAGMPQEFYFLVGKKFHYYCEGDADNVVIENVRAVDPLVNGSEWIIEFYAEGLGPDTVTEEVTLTTNEMKLFAIDGSISFDDDNSRFETFMKCMEDLPKNPWKNYKKMFYVKPVGEKTFRKVTLEEITPLNKDRVDSSWELSFSSIRFNSPCVFELTYKEMVNFLSTSKVHNVDGYIEPTTSLTE